jgi:hypothetical protein
VGKNARVGNGERSESMSIADNLFQSLVRESKTFYSRGRADSYYQRTPEVNGMDQTSAIEYMKGFNENEKDKNYKEWD